VAHDFWRFIINKYIRMRGQDLIKKINDQRTAKDKDTDSGSLRSNLAGGGKSQSAVTKDEPPEALASMTNDSSVFINDLEHEDVMLDVHLFPTGKMEGHRTIQTAPQEDVELVDDEWTEEDVVSVQTLTDRRAAHSTIMTRAVEASRAAAAAAPTSSTLAASAPKSSSVQLGKRRRLSQS
jgi:hypothetical protein